ncbi:hypothetical protein SDC64_00970 [Acinetobacter haemolyticus]|uniref:phage baseplate protein n=1 Tax=Acinetobacter haemolyticus TaxID=29430 RepID=UPI002A6988B9|nr:hypothetical protein [Acinetobacter haemolyticus]WPO67552.1 hypothetical protein SDC64_00970 [Acinetobacter haemolyticus]
MKRIDTVNARPDANGAGKAGFHDNADLSGQDATYIDPSWCNHVQEEIAAVIEGFGEALNPAQKNQVYLVVKGINDRTTAIENFIENIVDYFYPIGVVIDFGIPDFNPNVKYVGTTWVRHGEGKASVGLSTQETDSEWKKAVGNTYGSDTHTLTINEIPSHNHSEFPFNKFGARAEDIGGGNCTAVEYDYTPSELVAANITPANWVTATEKSRGGGSAHNIVQESIVDARWRRIA